MSGPFLSILTGMLFLWVPLAYFTRAADAFLLPKDILALMALALLAVGFLARLRGLFRTPLVLTLSAFAAWMVLESLVVGSSSLETLRGSFHLFLIAGVFLVVLAQGRGEGAVEKPAHFIFIAAAFMSLHGLVQNLGWDKVDWTSRFESRAFSTLGNPDYLAGFLVALLPLAWVMTLRSQTPRSWWALRALTLLLFAGLIATRVRGSFLALVAASFFLGAALLSPWGRELYRRNRGFILATLALLVVGGGAYLARHGGLSAFSRRQVSVQQRLDTYRVAWAMIQDHPLAGVGLGQFGRRFPEYQAKPWADEEEKPPYFHTEHVHNEFLQFWAEGGSVGLLLFLGVLVLWVGSIRKVLKDGSVSSESKDLLIGIAGGMVALLVQSLSNFPLQVAPTAILFGLYLAAPLVLLGGGAFPVPIKASGLTLVAWMLLLVPVSIIAVRELAVSVAYRDTVGETGLGHGDLAVSFGSRLVQLAPSDAKAWSAYAKALQSAGQASAAFDAYQRVLLMDPNAVEDLVAMADFELSQNHPQQAVELSKKALAIAPLYGGPLWPLAVGSFQLQDFAGAASTFERYIALSPNDYQPYLNLGVCYMRLGEREKAKAAWERAKALNPSDPQVELYLRSLNHQGHQVH